MHADDDRRLRASDAELLGSFAFRFPWEAALAFAVVAGLGSAFVLAIPQWWYDEQIRYDPRFLEALQPHTEAYVALLFLAAVATAIGTGLLAFAAWRLLLAPGPSFGLVPGAGVGALVGGLAGAAFGVLMTGPVNQHWGLLIESPLLVGALVGAGTAVVGGALGGWIGAAQGGALGAALERLERTAV